MNVPSIEARGLTKRFGSFTALDHLTLHLEGAKCVGFLGPNGSGKTTTLKLLTDLIYPSEGECFLNGISTRQDRTKALACAGVLIESPEIYPSVTPREALEMVADVRGVPRSEWGRRIETVLAEVKMVEWADKKVGKFSKGMKQRINIAAALVHDPAIVLLDEPSTGLDPRGMAEVRAIIRDLKRANRLIFMSSHLLSEVTDVCDEVALLNHGQLLFHDSLSNVIARFADGGGSVDVTLARPLEPGAVASQITRLPGVRTVTQLDARRWRLTLDRGTEGTEGTELLVKALVGLDLGVVGFTPPESALEEVYLSQISGGE